MKQSIAKKIHVSEEKKQTEMLCIRYKSYVMGRGQFMSEKKTK